VLGWFLVVRDAVLSPRDCGSYPREGVRPVRIARV
jgi:hypothetical protein